MGVKSLILTFTPIDLESHYDFSQRTLFFPTKYHIEELYIASLIFSLLMKGCGECPLHREPRSGKNHIRSSQIRNGFWHMRR